MPWTTPDCFSNLAKRLSTKTAREEIIMSTRIPGVHPLRRSSR
jgi:hypothetical protein